MENIVWLIFGGVALVASFPAGRSRRALIVGRITIGTLMIAAVRW